MRRKDKEMPESYALNLAETTSWGVLNLVDPSGNPYGVPLNFAKKGDYFYFHSATTGFKLECLKANKNVCITFVGGSELAPEEFTTKYQSAILRGVAEEVLDFQEKVEVLRTLGAKFAPEHLSRLQGEIDTYIRQTAIWKISIIEATGKVNK